MLAHTFRKPRVFGPLRAPGVGKYTCTNCKSRQVNCSRFGSHRNSGKVESIVNTPKCTIKIKQASVIKLLNFKIDNSNGLVI